MLLLFITFGNTKANVEGPAAYVLPADDIGVELVAGSLAMLTRQASLMRLHELVSARGGLTLEEVARATSSTVGAVKQRAHRAYERLRGLLQVRAGQREKEAAN